MQQQPDGTYVIVERPILVVLGALVFALGFVIAAWRRYEAHGLDVALALLALFVGASVTGAFAVPLRRFIFDPARKTIVWTSRSLFKADGGQVGFADVTAVLTQSTSGESGALTYRVALQTKDAILPLSLAYSGGRSAVEHQAKEIGALLGVAVTPVLRAASAAYAAETTSDGDP